MEPKLPNRLFLAAALLLSAAVCAFSAKQCPNCGLTSVPYPLSTHPTCGDQSYKIRCESGVLIFNTLNNSYPIISINPSNQRLVIKPTNLLPNTCISPDLIHQGIQLSPSLPFNITSENTVMLFNCSDTILDQPLDCSESSLCHSYVKSEEYSRCRDASFCCTFKAGGSASAYQIRVRQNGCRAYRSFVGLDWSLPVDKWPNPAVEIQWALPLEPVCESQMDCDADSTCEANPADGVKMCYCKAGLQWNPIHGICDQTGGCQSPGGCGKQRKTALIAGLTSSLGALFLLMISIGIIHHKRYKRIGEAQKRLARHHQEILSADGSKAAKHFTSKELKKATNDFSKECLIGAGGYGEVYKGCLEDGTVVAVKCAKIGNPKGTDQLLNEVRILCQVNHKTLVRLLGCCVELEQPILVYEYIQNGTLLDHLQGLGVRGKSVLSWIDRLRIAQDTAECIDYLHSSAIPPIYHRDIKSSNILLDDKLNARISDFGLSRLAYNDTSHISTCAQGTIGYLDPEYFRKFQLTDKSDVYSFGVVLLELLTSLTAIDFSRGEDNVNLAIYVQRMMEKEKLIDVIDPMLRERSSSMELDSMTAIAQLALACLEEKRENRPSMKEVAEDIEYVLNILTSNYVNN